MEDIHKLQRFHFDWHNGKHKTFIELMISQNEAFHLNEIFIQKHYITPHSFRPFNGPMTIVDIGSHVGCYSILSAVSYPESIIYAFEPCKKTFTTLIDNTRCYPQIKALNFGLYNETKEVPLYLNTSNSGAILFSQN